MNLDIINIETSNLVKLYIYELIKGLAKNVLKTPGELQMKIISSSFYKAKKSICN